MFATLPSVIRQLIMNTSVLIIKLLLQYSKALYAITPYNWGDPIAMYINIMLDFSVFWKKKLWNENNSKVKFPNWKTQKQSYKSSDAINKH